MSQFSNFISKSVSHNAKSSWEKRHGLCWVAASGLWSQALLLEYDNSKASLRFVSDKLIWQSSAMVLTCHVNKYIEKYCESRWIYENEGNSFQFYLIKANSFVVVL